MAKKPIKIARKKAGLPKSLLKVEATYKELQATEREISHLEKLRRKLNQAEQKSLRQLKQKRIRLGYEVQKRPPSRAKGTHTAIRQAAANIARAPVSGRTPKEPPKIAAAGTARTASRPTAVEQAKRRTETIRKEAVRQPPIAQRRGDPRTRKVKWTESEKVRTRKAPKSYRVIKGEPTYEGRKPVKGGAGNGRKTNKPPPSTMDIETARKISETRLHAEAPTHIAEGGTWDGRKSTMPKGPKSKWAKADQRLYERFMTQQRKAVAKGTWYEVHGRTAKYHTSGKQKGGLIFDNFLPEDKPLKPRVPPAADIDTGSRYSMKKPPKKQPYGITEETHKAATDKAAQQGRESFRKGKAPKKPKKITGAERARRAKASREAKPSPPSPEKIAERVAARAQSDRVRASLKKKALREPKPTKAELRKFVDATEAEVASREAKPRQKGGYIPKDDPIGKQRAAGKYKEPASRPQMGDPPKTYGAGTGPKPKTARGGPFAPMPKEFKKILRGKKGGGAWFIPIMLMQEYMDTGKMPAILKDIKDFPKNVNEMYWQIEQQRKAKKADKAKRRK